MSGKRALEIVRVDEKRLAFLCKFSPDRWYCQGYVVRGFLCLIEISTCLGTVFLTGIL